MIRFWTALQEPLKQAALVENGKIVKRIPDHASKTPARLVGVVGEYGNKLIIARKSDIQIWSRDGNEMIKQIYTPMVHAPHWIGAYEHDGQTGILSASGGLDAVYVMNEDAGILWEWWFGDHRERPDNYRKLILREDWLGWQLHQTGIPNKHTRGLNSIQKEPGGTVLVTLWRLKTAIRLQPFHKSKSPVVGVFFVEAKCPHDIQIDARTGRVVYGCEDGFVVNGKLVTERSYVKRVVQIKNGYAITHEDGVTITDMNGVPKRDIPLPRPFGVFHLEI